LLARLNFYSSGRALSGLSPKSLGLVEKVEA
jgi:hypothetical protein